MRTDGHGGIAHSSRLIQRMNSTIANSSTRYFNHELWNICGTSGVATVYFECVAEPNILHSTVLRSTDCWHNGFWAWYCMGVWWLQYGGGWDKRSPNGDKPDGKSLYTGRWAPTVMDSPEWITVHYIDLLCIEIAFRSNPLAWFGHFRRYTLFLTISYKIYPVLYDGTLHFCCTNMEPMSKTRWSPSVSLVWLVCMARDDLVWQQGGTYNYSELHRRCSSALL